MKHRQVLLALAVSAIFLDAGTVLAVKGGCSQPSSNGSGPAASDCLYILKVAVGSLTCSPQCICAPKGTLPTKSSDALLCLRKSVGQNVTLQCPCAVGVGDDFSDNSKDTDLWGPDGIDGNGVLNETSQVLQFTVSSGTVQDYVTRPWTGSVMPYSSDWEVQLDVANFTEPSQDDEVNSMGFSVFDESNDGNEVFAELYASHYGGPPARNGFYGELYDNGVYIALVDTFELVVTTGAVRIAFDAGTKVLTLYYDINPGNGYDWMPYGSFGVDGSGGVEGNADWGMTSGDRFTLAVYGFSTEMTIAPGEMFGDNFELTGAVAP